ncbi:phospho-N-acetylmuramoyl-pentapeptide-transferase [Ruminococcaceae bacterium OttesenSCG-928-O06]|nr:phospho-N-acetylmuramoyl-pentapeptide-transferase [Ruminococcaceae bacterium OttesenSCG-928-O06]
MQQLAMLAAAAIGLFVTALAGKFLIPYLRKIKFGQTINEIGPNWHKEKQGTPTMGGFLFIIGSVAAVGISWPILMAAGLVEPDAEAGLLVLGIFTALAFAAIGFIDDYMKVVRKQNLGLNARGKLVMQALVTLSFLITLHLLGRLSTIVRLPFFGVVDFGIWFYPLSFVLIIGMVNAVNLTDGLDGLASSVTLWVMCGFMLLLGAFGRMQLALWAAALAGSCVGFLFWNFYPAKVFMGDTGSMFLGGAVVALGYCMGRPDILIILGFLYLVEAFSVMIQVCYFKLTHGKRLFKMTPIHHHFELMGWSEVKIDVVFNIFTLLCVLAAYIYAVALA